MTVFVFGLAVSAHQAFGFSGARPEQEIPFELMRNKIIVPVRVNGSRELKIILDTGMPSQGLLIFDPQLTQELKLAGSARYLIDGAGRGTVSYALKSESAVLSLAGVSYHDQTVLILQNDTLAGFPSDGVIGGTLFGNHTVRIDYENQAIALLDPSGFVAGAGWEEIDLTFNSSHIPFLNAAVSVSGETEVPVHLYIDSASSEALELLVKPDMKIPLPEDLEQRYLGRGLSGDIYGQFGRIASFRLGSHKLSEVPTAFPKHEVRSRQEGADGVLCNNLLRRFHVIFDFAGRKLYLKPNRFFSEPFVRP